MEQRGEIVACFDISIAELISGVFEAPVEASSTLGSLKASLLVPSCGAPNLTLAESIQRSDSGAAALAMDSPEGLILDDPATPEIEADFWLHPCHCVPPDWGNNAPVTAEAVAEILAGSQNLFEASPFLVVEGAFVCEQEYLLGIHLAEKDPSAESVVDASSEFCRVLCAETDGCHFFWFGQVGESRQCWTYSQCHTLYRQVGLSGSLMAWPHGSQVCRIANVDLCWHVTKRREFLSASPLHTVPSCLHQSLFEQCDQKLMLGGTSISSCGKCKYALVSESTSTSDLTVPTAGTSVLSFDSQTIIPAETNQFGGSGLKFEASRLGFLLDTGCYYIKQYKSSASKNSSEVALEMTASWPSVVYLQWWDSIDWTTGSHLRLDPFKEWADYSQWGYVMNSSNPQPKRFQANGAGDLDWKFDSMWFSRAYDAHEDIKLYGSGATSSLKSWPYLVYICPKNIEALNSLQKAPMPGAFPHGSSVQARCWRERYSATSEAAELRCVGGSWVNAQGSLGLSNFECVACIQIVSANYRDLVLEGQQELYFATRWKLKPILLDGNGNSFAWNSHSCNHFVAELPGTDSTGRRFRGTDSGCEGKCLNATAEGLSLVDCSGSTGQLLGGNEVASQLLLKYLEENDANFVVNGATPGADATSLKDLLLLASCQGAFVMRGFSLGQEGATESDILLGMSKRCTPASIVDTDTEQSLRLKVVVRNSQYKSCLQWSDCVATDGGKCISSAAPCFESKKQLFVMETLDTGSFTAYDNADGADQTVVGSKFNLFADDAKQDPIRAYYFHLNEAHLMADSGGAEEFYYGTHEGEERKLMAYFDDGPTDNSVVSRWLALKQTGQFVVGWTQFEAASSFTVEPIEAFQWTLDELAGFSEAHIDCGSGHVIQDLRKTEVELFWTCSQVAGLGSCVELTSSDAQADSLEALRFLKLDCGENAAMQSLEFESNSISYSLRLKAKCCSLAKLPVVLNVTEDFSSDFYDGDLIPVAASEGIYCPTGLDESGRPTFAQSFSFKPDESQPQNTLQYNRAVGEWCLGTSCVEADVVHPLDLGESVFGDLQVMPFFNFDAKFVGQGVVPLSPPDSSGSVQRWQTPPRLLTFATEDPVYHPECKDEVYPGTGQNDADEPSFDRKQMNEEAQGLDVENPCHYIWSTQQGDGASWVPRPTAFTRPAPYKFDPIKLITPEGRAEAVVKTIKDRLGVEFHLSEPEYSQEELASGAPGQGLTYRTMQECSSRAGSRSGGYTSAKNMWALQQAMIQGSLQLVLHAVTFADGVADAFSWFGAPAKVVSAGAKFLGNSALTATSMAFAANNHRLDNVYNTAAGEDCSPLMQGLSRMFCDLHCIRNAVKTGDASILSQLETVSETISNNTRRLFEFYLSEDQGASLVQSQSELVNGIAHSLLEMKQMIQRARMHPLTAAATTRSIDSFLAHFHEDTEAQAANLSSHLEHMSKKVRRLHSLVRVTTSEQMSESQYVAENVAEYVKSMTEVMKTKAHQLGIFHHSAARSKERQLWLRSQATDTRLEDVLAEVRGKSIMLAMDSMDKTWWQLRAKFDSYFDSTEDHLAAFKTALEALDSYTDRCSMSFTGLKSAYTVVARANLKTRATLKEVWTATNPLVGLLVSQVLDTELLKELASNDVAQINATELLQHMLPSTWCKSEVQLGSNQSGLVRVQAAVASALQKGLFGQMLQQIWVLFDEMDMLVERFQSEGMGQPHNEEVLQDSKQRMVGLVESYAGAQQETASKLWHSWKELHCATAAPQ